MNRDELARRMYAVVENPDDWDREPETYQERYLRMADAVLAAMKPTTTTDDDTAAIQTMVELTQPSQQDRERNVWTQALIETAALVERDSVLDRVCVAAGVADQVLAIYRRRWGQPAREVTL